MRNRYTLPVVLAFVTGACGSGEGGGRSGPTTTAENRSPTAPAAEPQVAPPVPPPSTNAVPPAPEAASLRVESVEVPASVQPGERMRVDWRAVSDRPLVETRVLWGTEPDRVEEPTSRTFTAQAGTFSYTDSVKVTRRDGVVYVAVHAIDSNGNRAATTPVAIPVRWASPDGALVFSATTVTTIANGAARDLPLDASGQGVIETVEVRVDLEHARRGDVSIGLVAPSGRVVRLFEAPTDEEPNVLGTFGNDLAPLESLTALRGEPIRGRWTLRVVDAGSPAGALVRMWALAITPRVEVARRELALPNLVALPPDDLSIIHVGGRKSLAFGSRLRNAGAGPCALRGEVDRTTGRTRAWQQVMNKLRSYATGEFLGFELAREVVIGDFVFDGHESHDHWHLADVADYSIRDEALRRVASVASLAKITRCLTDSRRYDFRTIEGAPASRAFLCGQAKQGISVAWEDNYGAGTDGQYLDVSQLPDGTYYVLSELMTRLEESGDDVDNSAATRFRLTGDRVEVLEQLEGRALRERRVAVGSAP